MIESRQMKKTFSPGFLIKDNMVRYVSEPLFEGLEEVYIIENSMIEKK